MKLGVDWSQPSTIRGAIWLVTAIAGGLMLWAGKDVSQLLVLAGGVAGGLGVAVKD